MKRVYFIFSLTILTFFIASNTLSGQNTILPNDYSKWSFKYDIDLINQDLPFENETKGFSWGGGFSIYYKNIFLRSSGIKTYWKNSAVTKFEQIEVEANSSIINSPFNLSIGYEFTFNNKWSAEISVGDMQTTIKVKSPDKNSIIYKSEILFGFLGQVGITRYFTSQNQNNYFIGLGFAVDGVDYNSINNGYPAASLIYTLSIGQRIRIKNK